jgi:hypothetical protein
MTNDEDALEAEVSLCVDRWLARRNRRGLSTQHPPLLQALVDRSTFPSILAEYH